MVFKKGHQLWKMRRVSFVGKNNPFYGKKHTKETKKKMKLSQEPFKKIHSKRMKENNPMFNLKTKEKMIKSRIGKKHTEEHKRRISQGNKGKIGWNRGLTKEIDERVKNMSISKKGKKSSRKGKTFEEIYGKERAKEITRLTSGKNHPRWLGGKSFEPYSKDFNNKFKRAIRKRDNYICMLCEVHREKLTKALDVHHINYDKKLNLPHNCISLCHKCHMSLVHIKRDKLKYWTKFFQSLLSEKYGYKYSKDNKIVLQIIK